MVENEKISASLEDYLECIWHIEKEKGAVRTSELSRRMSVSNPSATGALKTLCERGFVEYEPHGLARLTDKGCGVARDIIRRHDTLRDFFSTILLADEKTSEDAACRMEHSLTTEMTSRFIRFMEFMERCNKVDEKWQSDFKYYVENGKPNPKCSIMNDDADCSKQD